VSGLEYKVVVQGLEGLCESAFSCRLLVLPEKAAREGAKTCEM